MFPTNKSDDTLPGGLASHRTQASAALAAFEDKGNENGVPLTPKYKLTGVNASTAARFRKLVVDVPQGHFLTVDVPIIVEYCVVQERLELGREEFLKAKPMIRGGLDNKVLKPNPFLTDYGRLQRRAVQLARTLRLAPIMRRVPAKHGQYAKSKKIEQQEQEEQKSQPSAAEVIGNRDAMMFGGRRAAEALGVADDG